MNFSVNDLPPAAANGLRAFMNGTLPPEKLTGTLGCVVAVRDMDKSGLKISDVAVLQYLASRANSECKAWPSQSLIAEGLGSAVSTVKRAVDRLELAGLISIEPVENSAGGIRFNRYTINLRLIESKRVLAEC